MSSDSDLSTVALEIIRGDDEAILITIVDADNNDESLIVAGSVFFLTIKTDIDDPDSEAIFKDDYEVLATTDEYTIDLSNTETELPLGTYYADIQWKDENGKIKTIYRGNFTVSYDVTRRKS